MLAAAAPLLAGSAAWADACRQPAAKSPAAQKGDCPQGERLQPYDPDRVKAGRIPGFVDLGNGTELRIGGRVRMDYDRR